jgi:hypothetical protein
MNQKVMNTAAFSCTPASSLPGRPSRGRLLLMAVLCLLVLPTAANAACGSFGAQGLKSSIKLPIVPVAELGPPLRLDASNPPIVGLWHVVYTNGADQSTFNDTFDTWHSDGTEFESAFLAPLGGNVCVGVWRQTGPRSVTLHHVGWLFSPDTPAATATNIFTLDEKITVSPDCGSYSGTFTFKVWNLDGSSTPVEVTGTISATRITPN